MDKWVVLSVVFGIVALALIALQPVQLAKQNDLIQSQNEFLQKQSDSINKTLTDFVKTWKQRIPISNKVNNATQLKVEQTAVDILNNLSAHRFVTNATFDKVQENEHVLLDFVKKFNNTNEVERGKAVDKIIKSVEEIKNLLNKTS